MKKAILVLCSVLVSACVGIVSNPYSNLNSNQIQSISTPDLCSVAGNSMYQSSESVTQEVKRRGLSSCSENEVHCVGLGAAPGTPAYVSCMVEQEKMDLQASIEEKRLRQEKASVEANQAKKLNPASVEYNKAICRAYAHSNSRDARCQ